MAGENRGQSQYELALSEFETKMREAAAAKGMDRAELETYLLEVRRKAREEHGDEVGETTSATESSLTALSISESDKATLQEIDPKLLSKVEVMLRAGIKINCHGASAYLSGLETGYPKPIDPEEMVARTENLKLADKPKKGQLVLSRIRDMVAHSGVVLTETNDPLILHKGGYNESFKVESLSHIFKGSKVEFYSI